MSMDNMTEEEIETELKILLQLSHEEFDYGWDMIDHPVATFRKYSYMSGKGVTFKQETMNTGVLGFSAELNKGEMEAIANIDPKSNVKIKVENPHHFKMKQTLTILVSARSSLDKLVIQGKDMHDALSAKVGKDKQASEIKGKYEELDRFLVDVRTTIIKAELADPSSAAVDMVALEKSLSNLVDAAKAHQQGMKLSLQLLKQSNK